MTSNNRLEKLTTEYRATFPHKKDQLESAFLALSDNGWSQDALADLKQLVHKLSGSTGTYGFTELARLTQSLDNKIDQFKKTDAEKEVLNRIFSEVLEQFDRHI